MSVSIPFETIKEIAGQLDMGMKCFYHKKTGELESYPDEMRGFADFDDELWKETMNKVDVNFQDYISFEAMESHESFRMMEDFVDDIADKKIRQRFEDAIGYEKPFQNFKQLLLNYPDLRQQWFAYKDQRMLDYVKEQVEAYNNSLKYREDDAEDV
jgi:hypothetical protein